MQVFDRGVAVFLDHIDLISSLASFVGSLACLYMLAIVLRERVPLVHLQRAALGALAIALFANGLVYYPDWELAQGHRPTGAAVVLALMMVFIVSAIRGTMIHRHDD